MKNMKKLKQISIAMLLIISVVSSFTVIEAEDFKPQDVNTEMGIYFNVATAEVGDNFNATIYLNPGGETVTTWKIYNLTYNEDRLGIVNATGCIVAGQWRQGFADDGSIHNDTGNISNTPVGFQSFWAAGTGTNYTAARVNFTALYPGTLTLKFSDHQDWDYGIRIDDGDGPVTNHTVNATLMIYPQDPASFTATAYNYTAINLSWTKGEGDDNVTVCGKAGSYPTGPSDSVLYNGTNLTYNHTSLDNCTTYYYRAWGWNETTNMHSNEYDSATATTWCYTNISFAGTNPTNNTKIDNCTYTQTVNVTINNAEGRTCHYWINASNGQTASGTVDNASVSLALTGLSHNTTYWWNVTSSELGTYGTQDSTQVHYHFRTGEGGGTAPTGSNPGPSNGATSVAISPVTFNVTVADADSDPVNVSFFWANDTFIGNHNMTYPGNSGSTTFTTYPLNYNTTYQWYALLNDTGGCAQSTRYPSSGYFSFTTDEPIVTLSKEWMVHANNTLEMWINTTNVGEINLTTGYINETWSYDYLTLVGATQTADGTDPGRYNITWLNVTGEPGHWYNLTLYFSLRAPMPNGTSLSDTATVYFNETVLNTFTPTSLPTMCYYATKEMNTTVKWNTSSMTFWINVTNCGDFYLNWTQINETYSANITYDYSSYPPNATNETFNITQLAPGGTNTTLIRVNKTAPDWVNGTRLWNNITLHSNQTSDETTFTNYWYVGARTTQIRVTYDTVYYDTLTTANSVVVILGVAIIIGLLVGMIYVFYNRGYGGGW